MNDQVEAIFSAPPLPGATLANRTRILCVPSSLRARSGTPPFSYTPAPQPGEGGKKLSITFTGPDVNKILGDIKLPKILCTPTSHDVLPFA